MGKHNPNYPVGRSRLEALSVLAAASIMTITSVEVIQYSSIDISDGIHGDIPQVESSVTVIVILSLCIFLKIALYIYCTWAQKILESDILGALAEDHINDVFSNLAAIISVLVAANIPNLWWFDPAGAILISVIIIYRWMWIIWEQVKKIVGYTAPPEFIAQVEDIAREHDPRLSVDCVRAYHSGARCKCLYLYP
jgi:divalent metal cation (Fe/Co/Zn/Cd) transporter